MSGGVLQQFTDAEGTAVIVGGAKDADSRSWSVVRHHLPQLLEEVLDEDEVWP